MLLQGLAGALLLAAGTAQAFSHAAPFFMLSHEPIANNAITNTQIARVTDVENQLLTSFRGCKQAAYYVFIQQEGIKARDVTRLSMPHLYSWINRPGNDVAQSSIPEVIGDWDLLRTMDKFAERCGLDVWRKDAAKMIEEKSEGVVIVPLGSISDSMSESERAKALEETDIYINSLLRLAQRDTRPWIVVFSGSQQRTPGLLRGKEHQDVPYEMDEPYPSPLHTDLKRDVEAHKRAALSRRQSNATDNGQAGLPLFEKYKFLSPAIFMGLTVTLLLILILYVGISAIANLEVSYAAFSKEMGPQAQKSKQQ